MKSDSLFTHILLAIRCWMVLQPLHQVQEHHNLVTDFPPYLIKSEPLTGDPHTQATIKSSSGEGEGLNHNCLSTQSRW